jgi:hypothetical protein
MVIEALKSNKKLADTARQWIDKGMYRAKTR